jgi:rhodanese-related sulfurtransferase
VSAVKRVSPEDAKVLLDEGYVYLDVRTEQEFEQGHPPGAYNIPLSHQGPGGMQPNPDFLDVVQASFPKDARLLLGCRSGARSLRALQVLQTAGYTDLVDLKTGFEGSRDAFGRPDPGWHHKGLPVETGHPEGLCYRDVHKKARG